MATALPQVVASAARTTSGNSGTAISTERQNNIALLVNVTASSGTTPTLNVTVQWSADGVNFAPGDPADAFTQITGNVAAAKAFAVKGAFWRPAWAIAGTTPSFTFTVDAVTY